MTYIVGEYIDLSHIGKAAANTQPNKSFQETINTLFEVGTSLSFKEGFKVVRHIPVTVLN